jgi:hypothetical protein
MAALVRNRRGRVVGYPGRDGNDMTAVYGPDRGTVLRLGRHRLGQQRLSQQP